LAAALVSLCRDMVEKPWSAVITMSVSPSSPWSLRASRSAARSFEALRNASCVVGPLIPGVSVFRESPWSCWLPSGSRDQKTSTKGLPAALNLGSSTLVATPTNQSCCATLALVVPGVSKFPLLPLGPRSGATAGSPAAWIAAATSGASGTPRSPCPVASSMTMVPTPVRAVTSWIAAGPCLPRTAVEKPFARAASSRVVSPR
jgi:hypothetical protein